MKRAVTTLGFALALLVAGGAHAQSAADVATARELFVEASTLAKQGDWDGARDRYARSLALKRAPITLYSLGIAQKNTGHLVEALENLRAFLAEPIVAATKPYERPAHEAIAELEKRVGELRFEVTPPGVEHPDLTIDGAAVPEAALDRPRLVDPGDHEIRAKAAGRRDALSRIHVAEGEKAVVHLRLDPLPIAPVAPPPPPPAPAEPSTERAPSRAGPVALVLGGGAVFAAGAVVGIVGLKHAYDAPTRDGPQADAARRQMLIGDVVGGVGVVVAGIGLIWLATQHGGARHGRAEAPRSATWIGPRGAGVGCVF